MRKQFIAIALGFACPLSGAAVYEVVLPAQAGPDNMVNTGIVISQRDYVRIQAWGEVSLAPGLVSTPAGVAGEEYCDGFTPGAVISSVYGHRLAIEGGDRAWTAGHNGTLGLYVNDCNPGNNSGSYLVIIEVGPELTGDNDGDGLEDPFEDEVLATWAPHIRFDQTEASFPVTLQHHARISTVEYNKAFSPPIKLARWDLEAPFYPEWHLAFDSPFDFVPGGKAPGESAAPANITRLLPEFTQPIPETRWRMGHWNEYRKGMRPEWINESDCSIGLYGRAARCVEEVQGQDRWYITVLYMQLFSFSDSDVTGLPDFGEHEGDWEFIELEIDYNALDPEASLAPDAVRRAKWWAHGGFIEWRAAGEPHPDNSDVVLRQDTWWDTHGACASALEGFPTMPPPNQHIPALVQAENHGFFPMAYDWDYPVSGGVLCIAQGLANGDGVSGTPLTVTNVGEPFRPRLGCELLAQYTGRWGAENSKGGVNPRSPFAQDGGDKWPRGVIADSKQQFAGRYVGLYDNAGPIPQQLGGGMFPAGEISAPHQSVQEAVAVNSVPGQQSPEIIVYPGVYTGELIIDHKVRIRAPHGGVIITAD